VSTNQGTAPERTGISGLLGAIQERIVGDAPQGEGLRERKKRETRQHISDTATGMFLERGFDQVKVAEVAAACGVSEKTVYNYFPTKESLLLDREDATADAIRAALGPDGPHASPIEAALAVVTTDVMSMFDHWAETDRTDFAVTLDKFSTMVLTTPSLRAAQLDMMERLLQVAAEAMAERAGVDPQDPEPQVAAGALMGLWRIQFRSMVRHADGTRSAEEVRDAVIADVNRAARLIDTGLWSFSAAVQGNESRQQLRDAADAANEARKQVLAALRQAREAWKQVKVAHDLHDQHHRGGPRDRGQAQRDAQQARSMAKQVVAQAKREAASGRAHLKRDAAGAARESARVEAAAKRADARRPR